MPISPSPLLKTFFIVRHGETDLNKKGIVQGRGINSSLNDLGKSQAAQFYLQYGSLPFDKLYTSTLIRTHQTMAAFIEAGLAWEQLPGLDEMAWGIYEGVESSERLREDFRSLTSKWAAGDLMAHFTGGESPLDVQKRQREALTVMLSHSEERLILVCMHGRAIRLFMCLLLGVPLSQMDEFPHQNLSLYKIGYDGAKFLLLEFNNTSHLTENILEG